MALTGKRDMAMCSRRQDRSRLCIWHLNLRAIKQMSALSEHHMRELTFTPAMWENMNRKEFHLTGSWMSYSAPFPGKEWELTAHYFATGQLKFDPGFIYKKVPMSQAQEHFRCSRRRDWSKEKCYL